MAAVSYMFGNKLFVINKRTNIEEIFPYILNMYGKVFFNIGSYIYYKTQAEMCYKWIKLSYLFCALYGSESKIVSASACKGHKSRLCCVC